MVGMVWVGAYEPRQQFVRPFHRSVGRRRCLSRGDSVGGNQLAATVPTANLPTQVFETYSHLPATRGALLIKVCDHFNMHLCVLRLLRSLRVIAPVDIH